MYGKETSRIREGSGCPKGELSTESVFRDRVREVCVEVSTRPQGRRCLSVVCLSVVSHEAELGIALVCGTDLV